jgi:hypothetical protein
MKSKLLITGIALLLPTMHAVADNQDDKPLSFFVTSSTHSGNLQGLEGADNICQTLASEVGQGSKTWRAYLSTHGTRETPAVNARDRIGSGPWYNANGVLIASNIADLHGDIQRDSNLITSETALTENGKSITGRNRPKGVQNEHDMLTGSDSHGRAYTPGASRKNNFTCNNWTSESDDSIAMVGHHDRASSWNTSWNSSHSSAGCSLQQFNKTGGAGRFYCFSSE